MNEVLAPDRQQLAPLGASQSLADTLALISRFTSSPDVDVMKLHSLLDFQERLMKRQAEVEFTAAFIRLSGKLPRIKKSGVLQYPIDKNNPDGPKRKIANFAKWEDIDAAIRPLLQEEGFVLQFGSSQAGDRMRTTCQLMHEAGHSKETEISLPCDSSGGKNNLQGYGSTLSYGQRYCAKMILNLIFEDEDDDGVRGADEFIDDTTVANFAAEMKRRRVEERLFFDFLGIRSLNEMHVRDVTKAKNALKSWKVPPAAAAQP